MNYSPDKRDEELGQQMVIMAKCINRYSWMHYIAPTIYGGLMGCMLRQMYNTYKKLPTSFSMKWFPQGCIAGFVAARIATRYTCYIESLVQLERKRLNIREDPHSKREITADESPVTLYDDYKPMESYEGYSSFNDSSDIDASAEIDLTEDLTETKPTKKVTSYTELRARNRAQATPTHKYPQNQSRQHSERAVKEDPFSEDLNDDNKFNTDRYT